jgi:predicted nucleotidyltransferase
MKTSLPENSLVIKDRLDAIVQEILAVARDQISMIILFGSYAKGTWVRDWYVEGHITYSYESDLERAKNDLKARLKSEQDREMEALEHQIQDLALKSQTKA